MKKPIPLLILLSLCYLQNLQAQAPDKRRAESHADEADALKQVKEKQLSPSDAEGYARFLKNDLSSREALKKQAHICTPYEQAHDIYRQVIMLQPNKPASAGCPNMGFEQYNFSGWSGTTGTISSGTSFPIYTVTGNAIVNSAGINVSAANTVNYHTIMTVPPSNPNYPSCTGYDSLACKAVGASTVSQVPFISPYSTDPVSVRINSANANYRACNLKYITTTSSTNKQLSYSYAVVLSGSGHTPGDAPYFKVTVKNETANTVISGCGTPSLVTEYSPASDSLMQSPIGFGILYTKWRYVSIDLSSLPPGTSVSVSFEAAGCAQGGHWCYAYVDASCGNALLPHVDMCPGSASASLVAPAGFNAYQWSNPAGTSIAGATNDTLVIPSPVIGDVYSVKMTTGAGCTVTATDTVKVSTVSVTSISALPSCINAGTGSSQVSVSGSNNAYTYTWTSIATGSVVSTAATATGLPPGSYSVTVASAACGQATASVSVGTVPALFSQQSKSFCGNSAALSMPGGMAYAWYHGSVPVAGAAGSNDTLNVINATGGDNYTLSYINSTGCRDSIQFTLVQVQGNYLNVGTIHDACSGSSNGAEAFSFVTTYPGPYSYLVTGAGNSVITNTTISTSSLSVSSLPAGTYSVTASDGTCTFNETFTIGTVSPQAFTVTPASTSLCFPSDTAKLKLDFGNLVPASCAINAMVCQGSSTVTLFPTGTFTQNGGTTYPSPYANWYSFARTQFLVRKSDLAAAGLSAGNISSLSFHVLNMNTSTASYAGFSIKMGCTSLTALPSTAFSAQSFIPGLQTVYSNAAQPVSPGWVTHQFSQPYMWDGNSNIIVELCSGVQSFSYTNNVSVELMQMPYNTCLFYKEDSNPACGGTQQATSGGEITNGTSMLPNMKFGYCPFMSAADYTVSVSSNGILTHNYGNDSIKVVPSVAPSPSIPVVYTVTAVSPNAGCSSTQTVAISYPTGSVSISASQSNTILCQGSSLALSASGAASYQWYYQQGSTQVPVSTSPSFSVVPPAAGTNTYIVMGYAPCTGNAPDTKTITVNVLAAPALTATGTGSICAGTGTVLAASGASAYSWSTGAATASISVMPAASTNYTVTGTGSNSCTATQTLSVTVNSCIPTGLSELPGMSLAVYPNPANHIITIAGNIELQKIELTDIAGQILLGEKATGMSHQVDVSGFAEGIYFITAYGNEGVVKREKIVVEK